MSLTKSEIQPGFWAGTHIVFQPLGVADGQKTARWSVRDKTNNWLGDIKWFGSWRKYCFFPAPECVFEEVCMRELAQFIVDRTADHREARRQAQAST